MGDDEYSAIQVAIQGLTKEVKGLREDIREIKQDRKECRTHCDQEMPAVNKRITDHLLEHAKFNPVWLYAVGALVVAFVTVVQFFYWLK